MKILIYGFGPFRQHKYNLTEDIVKNIKSKKGFTIKKVIFPAKFSRSLILNTIKKAKPDIIIGLGMHPRAKKIRQERKAINTYRNSKKDKPKRITKGPEKYFCTLKFRPTKQVITTYKAGTYVCNFSMYTILHNTELPFAFFHMPKNYNVKKAVKQIERLF